MPEPGPDAPGTASVQPPPPPPPPPAPKESPFSIKNLLNGDHHRPPPKPQPPPRTLFAPASAAAAKGALEGAAGFALSQVGDLAFPRFEIPAQRFALPAHYLERSSAWWYPYTLTPAGGHLPRPEGTDLSLNFCSPRARAPSPPRAASHCSPGTSTPQLGPLRPGPGSRLRAARAVALLGNLIPLGEKSGLGARDAALPRAQWPRVQMGMLLAGGTGHLA